MENEKITLSPCCYICKNQINKDKCPLFDIYVCAKECGYDDSVDKALYHVKCNAFTILDELRQNKLVKVLNIIK